MVADNEQTGYNPAALEGLVKFIRICEQVDQLSDEALSTEVLHRIWAQFPHGTVEDVILSELLTRFDRLAGIVRDEDGVASS
jgi:hypothetical protein